MPQPWERDWSGGSKPWERQWSGDIAAPAPAAEPAKPTGAMDILKGVGDAALTLGAGTVMTPIAGLAGLGSLALGQGAEKAADVTKAVQGFAYQPHTEGGKKLTELAAIPMEKYSEAADAIARAASTGPDQQLGETAAYTALMSIPSLLGLKKLGKRAPAAAATPSAEELTAQAKAAYAAAEQSGVSIPASTMQRVAAETQRVATENAVTARTHPAAVAAARRINAAAKDNQTLLGTEAIRRDLNTYIDAAANRADRRAVYQIRNAFDDARESWGVNDVMPGTAAPEQAVAMLGAARDLWSRMRKSGEIEDLVRKAHDRAEFSESALTTTLRGEFRKLVTNDKRMARFSADEQAALRDVARGGIPAKAMRLLSHFAPHGIVRTGVSAGLGAAAGGPMGSAVALGLGQLGKMATARGLMSRAARAAEIARRGAPLPVTPTPFGPLALTGANATGIGLLNAVQPNGVPLFLALDQME